MLPLTLRFRRRQNKKASHKDNKVIVANFIESLNYNFIRGLPLYELEKIIKRKSQMCNWCGIQKKTYLCCDQNCSKTQLICPECSIEWVQHSHFMHQFMYIMPLLSYQIIKNHDCLIAAYNNLKNIQIKANFHLFQKLSKFYSKIEKQLTNLDMEKQCIHKQLKNIQQGINSHESKLSEFVGCFKKIINFTNNESIHQKYKNMKKLELQLALLVSGQSSNDHITSQIFTSQRNQSLGVEHQVQDISIKVQIQQLITSKSIITFTNNQQNYHKISKFYSDNMRGLSIRLVSLSQNIKNQNSLYLLQNIHTLQLTGQANILFVITILTNSQLKVLKLDYITLSTNDQSDSIHLPYTEQQTSQISQYSSISMIYPKKLASNIVFLEIQYPSVSPITNLFKLCSFPQLCHLQFHQIYEPKNSLQQFIKDILIRLPRLQYIVLSTYLSKEIIKETIHQILQYRQDTISQQSLSSSMMLCSNYILNRKRRYKINCLNRHLMEIRLNEDNFRNNEPLEQQNFGQNMMSLGFIEKSKVLMNLVQYYRKKNNWISQKVINELIYDGLL